MIRGALDLKRGGEHEVEIPPHTTLKEYFGMYSISGKAYRTYGGPNKFFGEIARILMEYAFVHTNPTSMPQNKAAIIIREYEGDKIDWCIITGEGVRVVGDKVINAEEKATFCCDDEDLRMGVCKIRTEKEREIGTKK